MGEQDKRVKKMVVSVVVERRHRCPAAGFWRHIAAAWLWVRLTASRWVGLLVVGLVAAAGYGIWYLIARLF